MPISFSGAAFYNPRVTGPTHKHAAREDRTVNVAILAPQSTGLVPQNRGNLGDPAPLTSMVTVI